MDLTAAASADGSDWAHFGGPDSDDHKANGGNQISDVSQIGSGAADTPGSYGDNFTAYSWSDGLPTASSSATTTGAFNGNFGVGTGLSITVAANQTPRVLSLYVGTGGDADSGTLTLTLGSLTYTTTATSGTGGKFNALYTIDYQGTAPGQALTVDWVTASGTSAGYANATMQAAVVVPEPGSLALLAVGGAGLLAWRKGRTAGV